MITGSSQGHLTLTPHMAQVFDARPRPAPIHNLTLRRDFLKPGLGHVQCEDAEMTLCFDHKMAL